MNWKPEIKGFTSYLKLERGLAANSISAYQKDVAKLADYLETHRPCSTAQVTQDDLQGFIAQLHDLKMTARSQARILSGIKAFFKFLLMEKIIASDPSELLQSPKLGMRLPKTLTIEEVSDIIESIDLSRSGGARDRTMLEVLYGCGLRVSELIELKISNIHFKAGYLRVIGKGDKERLVPVGGQALKQLQMLLDNDRKHCKVLKGYEDHVFLNKMGSRISRISVFKVIKRACLDAGVDKVVSPHTFRHSFATHLVQGGADLRAVQDMLGHESITTTEIYSHLDRDYLRAAILEFHPLEGT